VRSFFLKKLRKYKKYLYIMATYKEKFNLKYGFPKGKSHSLKEISEITGYKLDGLKKIDSKGRGAYFTNPESVRPLVKKRGGPVRWGLARVYSAVMGGKTARIDKDLLIKK
jgi:hypothetical protein